MAPAVLRLRRYFLVGLVVIAPVGVTAVVLRWIFQTVDAILGEPLQAALGVRIPGLGFVLLGLVVLGVGWVVHRAVGRRMLHAWNRTLVRFPVAGRLYNAASQIVQSFASDKARLFKSTVFIPYPLEGTWTLAFVTNDDVPLLTALLGVPCVTVFVPTPPNPATGVVLVVPRDRLIPTSITLEEAFKFVISVGALVPAPGDAPSVRRGLDLDDLFRDHDR
jgi:uncharacterized membrane protein